MGVHVLSFGLSCIIAWSLGLCSASPTAKPKLGVGAPHEQCFDRTCNRVTHYCDQVIMNCASCEDDCHPSRITDDEHATKECQRNCDWYYYIKSLNERNESRHIEESKQTEEHEGVAVDKYYVTIIVVLTVCFTVIVIFILALFACYVRRQSRRPLVVSQETRGTVKKNIYRPFNLEKTTTPVVDPKNSSNETSLKLLSDYDNTSFEVRAGQQESVQQNVANRSAICYSGSSQNRSGKSCSAHLHASLPLSQKDSSIQPLVK